MKRLFFIIITILSVCSCNSCKLEWWEVINPCSDRIEKAKGRNDNTSFNRALFSSMEDLESNIQQHRLHEIKRDTPEKEIILNLMIRILGIVFTLGLIVLVIYYYIKKTYSPSRAYTLLCIWTSVTIILGIVNSLFLDNPNKGNSIDLGCLLQIIGLTLSVPFVLMIDDVYSRRDAPFVMVLVAFMSLIIGMIIGVFWRTATTFGVYAFVLIMLIYTCIVLVKAICNRESFFRILTSSLYLLLVTLGIPIITFFAMAGTVSFFRELFFIVALFCFVFQSRTTSSRKEEEEYLVDDNGVKYRPLGDGTYRPVGGGPDKELYGDKLVDPYYNRREDKY